ncbi:GGDEF domain-containing protein [Paralcaligenes sp. KSB-10]|uniref:GGDEF domain-containing protein n=1 Tax=Paralcaligenes sp. KSB-10 TaxID=2901142 RepID=UPI001E50BCEF|nr:GGDEF domain-containing protein [Paralcaligenes sp. KSB-10]UHL63662.1 GGDEF domain-containing protein [Paralcaligenes sp. KSB-10]
MSFIANENEVFGHRADFLAMEVLSVQLNILQVFMPMDCWFVGRQEEAHVEVVATFGGVDAIAASHLASLLASDGNDQGAAKGFSHRPVSEMELKALASAQVSALHPRHVFKADLRRGDGRISGMVAGFLSQQLLPGVYPPSRTREIALCLSAIAQTLSMHVELAAAEKLVLETQQDAQIDSLTKVLNRAGWNKKLRSVASIEEEVAIGFLDLDFLKLVNDSHGHLAGDDLLRRTAQTIKAELRNNDCIARLGGDEFAVMLRNVATTDASELKKRLQLALSEADIKASIGVALKSEAGSLQKALQLADSRMYEEKRTKQRPLANNSHVLNFGQV